MANIEKIARLLGADVVDRVPDTGPGLLGTYRLAHDVAQIQIQRSIPLSPATYKKLEELAKKSKPVGGPISPLQLAAELLEVAIDRGLSNAGIS